MKGDARSSRIPPSTNRLGALNPTWGADAGVFYRIVEAQTVKTLGALDPQDVTHARYGLRWFRKMR